MLQIKRDLVFSRLFYVVMQEQAVVTSISLSIKIPRRTGFSSLSVQFSAQANKKPAASSKGVATWMMDASMDSVEQLGTPSWGRAVLPAMFN